MNILLITAITAITQALIFYTIGVWAEHRAKVLKWSHFVLFLIGFIGDCSGTMAMSMMAKQSAKITGYSIMSLHGITGALASIDAHTHHMGSYRAHKGQQGSKGAVS